MDRYKKHITQKNILKNIPNPFSLIIKKKQEAKKNPVKKIIKIVNIKEELIDDIVNIDTQHLETGKI